MCLETITAQFVDLALKYQLEDLRELTSAEIQILSATVSAAGFDFKEIVPGQIILNIYDQDDRDPTGETVTINNFCPFKVIDQNNKDYLFATGWMDCAFRRVVFGTTRQEENRKQLIEAMQSEIERSKPLQPIQLTTENDQLYEYPVQAYPLAGLQYFVDHTRDDHNLDNRVGLHRLCNGWMDRHQATDECDAIVCSKCYLRILFPKGTKTYGELRGALALQHLLYSP